MTWSLTEARARRDIHMSSSPVAVFDRFVVDMNVLTDPLMLETAGAQCLLLAGFFEDQMRRRHNIHWYAELGAGFFRRAAAAEQSASKAKLLGTIGRHFEAWRRRHARLSHELRDSPYLLSCSRARRN